MCRASALLFNAVLMTETTTADWEALTRPDRLGPALVRATNDDRWAHHRAHLIAGGKSNLTFELVSTAGHLILRRPPSGELLPSAHDMGREARVQSALAGSPVPVPKIVLADPDGDILGVPAYVMQKVEGHIIRGALPSGFADTPQDRVAIADGLIDTLVALHTLNPQSIGLQDFGRPVGFVQRQVRRWRTQWDRTATHPVADMDRLADRLQANLPTHAGSAIVHGDFKLDNCVLDPQSAGRVAALLDWELSTLGDPLTDLGMLLFYWRQPGERPIPLVPGVTDKPGFPPRAYLAERYAAATGVSLDLIDYYVAFANFKFAAIAQGIAARVAAGVMAGQDFGDLDEVVADCAAIGLAVLANKG